MKNRWIWCVAAAACGVSFLMGTVVETVVAQEGEGGAMPMPEWMKLTREHEGFQKSVGDWKVTEKWWVSPDAAPMVTKAEASCKLHLNGRFLKQKYKSTMEGHPFEGRLYIGFDTLAKEYVSVWMDSMSPYLHYSRGKEVDGVLWFKGKSPDHMSGKMQTTAMSIEWKDDDEYVLTAYKLADDGSRTKTGELTYKRD